MGQLILRRTLYMIVSLWAISIVAFVVIQLPPGDFGRSFAFNKPTAELLAERVPLTMFISFLTLIVTYVIAVPIGIYSATNQYSWADNLFSGVGFMGLATPNFALALVLMWLGFRYFGISIGGLFSTEYRLAP